MLVVIYIFHDIKRCLLVFYNLFSALFAVLRTVLVPLTLEVMLKFDGSLTN